jgi:hypothetical protein
LVPPLYYIPMEITVCLGGVLVKISSVYDAYLNQYAPFACGEMPWATVSISREELLSRLPLYESGTSEQYAEHMELCLRCGDALLPHGRAIFHGAAFIWRGRALIITAESGTGKSTHYVQWKRLYGGEIAIINGDKPVLDFSREEIAVCPSPWRGKENMGSMNTAPLGGIIMLKKGPQNAMRRLSPKEAAQPLFVQFLSSMQSQSAAQLTGQYTERMLESVPVWCLENKGDEDSARLCRQTIEKEVLRP